MLVFLKFPITDKTVLKTGKRFNLRRFDVNEKRLTHKLLLETVEQELNISRSEFVLISSQGVKLTNESELNDCDSFQIQPLVLGGKGGFGSLLRSFGKQITKSTNKDACRDLTGRRMKHVNNEKRLKEFMEKQAEMAKEKESKKKEKSERRRRKIEQIESGSSNHVFLDPKYDLDREKINQDLEEALEKAAKNDRLKREQIKEAKSEKSSAEGIKNGDSKTNIQALSSSAANGEVNTKTQVEQVLVEPKTTKDVTTTKFKDWLGVGDLQVSSDSEEEEQPSKSMFIFKLLECLGIVKFRAI